jgi:hypothetical protein
MRKLLIAFTCIATIIMTSACSADSVDEITEFGREADEEIVPPPPVPQTQNTPPQVTGNTFGDSGDKDKDKDKNK